MLHTLTAKETKGNCKWVRNTTNDLTADKLNEDTVKPFSFICPITFADIEGLKMDAIIFL